MTIAGNNTVIANWSRSNPSDRKEAAVITKAMGSTGIENPSTTLSYTVATTAGKTGTGTTVTAGAITGAAAEISPASPGAPAPAATTAPGFGPLMSLAGLTLAAMAMVRLRR